MARTLGHSQQELCIEAAEYLELMAAALRRFESLGQVITADEEEFYSLYQESARRLSALDLDYKRPPKKPELGGSETKHAT